MVAARLGIVLIAVSDDEYVFTGGAKLSIATRWSAAVAKEQGEWRVANVHFSFDLFDNPLLTAARYGMRVACVLGLALGLLTGVLCSGWSRRRTGRQTRVEISDSNTMCFQSF
jgi:hypothetical protein